MKSTPLSKEQIDELKGEGYDVEAYEYGDQIRYGWVQGTFARQKDWPVQPLRRTKEQAWADCWAYARGMMPTQAEPDWKSP